MIIKRRVTRGFVQIPNEVVRDKRLTLDEHGMLHYLLSLPDDWEINLKHLEKYWKIGRDKRRRIFQSLQRTGWAQLERLLGDDGFTFLGARWIIGDEPGPELTEQALSEQESIEEQVDGTPMEATAAPESKGPAALAADGRETPFQAVGSDGGRVARTPENTAPELRRKTLQEEIDSTNTSEISPLTANQSASAADDDLDEGEPPPRFGELTRLWPSEHVVSHFACDRVFAKLPDKMKIQARDGIKPYLKDCRDKGQNRLCDLRTYLDERRWERFIGKPSTSRAFHVLPGTPQAYRWREYFERADPAKLPIFEMFMGRNGYTVPSEWPPALPPKTE